MPPLECEHRYKTTCSFARHGVWLQNHFLSRKGPQHGYTLGPRANSEIPGRNLKHWVRLAVKVTGCFLGGEVFRLACFLMHAVMENLRAVLWGTILRCPHGICVPVPFTCHLGNLLSHWVLSYFLSMWTKMILAFQVEVEVSKQVFSLHWDSYVSFFFLLQKGARVHRCLT